MRQMKMSKCRFNNLLKAITLSLLMEQVLAPNITFRRRSDMRPDEQPNPGDVIIDDTTLPASKKVVDILNKDSDDLIAALVQDTQNAKRYIQEDTPASAINETALPKIVALPLSRAVGRRARPNRARDAD